MIVTITSDGIPTSVIITCDKPEIINSVDALPILVKVEVFKDGAQGIQGIKGDKGDTGDVGATGGQGIQGIKGDKGDTGDVGATGAQGIQGIKGDKGDTGNVGVTGAQGIQGVKGDKGDTGNVGATGAQGIQGVKGDTGNTGATGAAGTNGSTWFSGSGVPSVGTGVNGDFYLNTATSDIYKKISGAWVLTVTAYNDVVLYQNNANQSTIAGTTTLTSAITPILIPGGTFAVGDEIIISIMIDRIGTPISSINCTLRRGTTNVFSSSGQIAFFGQTSTAYSIPMVRSLEFKTATSFDIINTTAVNPNDYAANFLSAPQTMSWDISGDMYLFVGIQPFNTGDSARVSRISIIKRKAKTSI